MTNRGRQFASPQGQYFQHARERSGISQVAAAEALELSVGTLSRYERGHVRIPDDSAKRMAALYGVEADGWRAATTLDADTSARTPAAVPAPVGGFSPDDPRYWSARWDQAVDHLRRLVQEQEALADEMRAAVYRPYRGGAAIPPAIGERLDQRIADQTTPDVLAGDDSVRARG